MRAIAEARIKTDTIDSQTLAHLLRCDLIPSAYAPTRQTRAVKRVLRQRCFLVQVRTMVKNRIAALLAQHEVRRPAVTDLYGRAGMQWLGQVQLAAPDDALLREHLDLIRLFNERIKSTEALLHKLSTGDAAVTWLRSIDAGLFRRWTELLGTTSGAMISRVIASIVISQHGNDHPTRFTAR